MVQLIFPVRPLKEMSILSRFLTLSKDGIEPSKLLSFNFNSTNCVRFAIDFGKRPVKLHLEISTMDNIARLSIEFGNDPENFDPPRNKDRRYPFFGNSGKQP